MRTEEIQRYLSDEIVFLSRIILQSFFDDLQVVNIYMLFTGREVRMGKNCARGLEYGPRP